MQSFNGCVEPGSAELLSDDLMLTSAVIRIITCDQLPVLPHISQKLYFSGGKVKLTFAWQITKQGGFCFLLCVYLLVKHNLQNKSWFLKLMKQFINNRNCLKSRSHSTIFYNLFFFCQKSRLSQQAPASSTVLGQAVLNLVQNQLFFSFFSSDQNGQRMIFKYQLELPSCL